MQPLLTAYKKGIPGFLYLYLLMFTAGIPFPLEAAQEWNKKIFAASYCSPRLTSYRPRLTAVADIYFPFHYQLYHLLPPHYSSLFSVTRRKKVRTADNGSNIFSNAARDRKCTVDSCWYISWASNRQLYQQSCLLAVQLAAAEYSFLMLL